MDASLYYGSLTDICRRFVLFQYTHSSFCCFEIIGATIAFIARSNRSGERKESDQEQDMLKGVFFSLFEILDMRKLSCCSDNA